MAVTKHDRWLIPARQYELPGRDLLPAAALHARRESMFLVFATLILTATVAVPLFADGTVVDLGAALGLSQTAELTLGVMVFPVALLVSQLVCELYGARRTHVLALAATFASAAIVSIGLAADRLSPIPLALAFLAYSAAALVANAIAFAWMRRALRGHHMVGRSLLAMATSQVIGLLSFVLVMYRVSDDVTAIRNIAAVAAAYACACAVVAALPLAIFRRGLAVYLRVGRTEDFAIDHTAGQLVAQRRHRLPPALLVDDEPGQPAGTGSGRRAGRITSPPFTHNELAFFLEGEELSESV